MEKLPVELLEKILRSDGITVRDLVNFSSTCKYFYYLVPQIGTIWKHQWRTHYYRFMKDLHAYQTSDYKTVRFIFSVRNEIRKMLDEMAHRFCEKEEVNYEDFSQWHSFLHATCYISKVELMDIIHTKCEAHTRTSISLSTPGHLTRKYYAHIVLRYVRQIFIEKRWKWYSSGFWRTRVMEKGAIFLAQWRQPSINIDENIRDKLDELANMVKDELRKDYPDHPVLQMSWRESYRCKKEKLIENVWSMSDCRLILCAITKVLYSDLNFQPCPNPPMEWDYYINIVLDTKVGAPELLNVVYEAVARRLNVHCTSMVNLDPNECLLRVAYFNKPPRKRGYDGFFVYTSHGWIVDKEYVKIDCGIKSPFEDKTVVEEELINQIAWEIHTCVSRMYRPHSRTTELRSVYDFENIVFDYVPMYEPKDLDALYASHNPVIISDSDSAEWVEELRQAYQPRRKTPEIRSVCELSFVKIRTGGQSIDEPEVDSEVELEVFEKTARLIYRLHYPERILHPKKRMIRLPCEQNHVIFAVGLVMYHKISGCKCVIFKWDVICRGLFNWALNNYVFSDAHKLNQPFYSVLMEDKSFKYVPQDELVAINDSLGSNVETELGKFFSHFYKSYYVPNQWLEEYYPTDAAIRDDYLALFEATS